MCEPLRDEGERLPPLRLPLLLPLPRERLRPSWDELAMVSSDEYAVCCAFVRTALIIV